MRSTEAVLENKTSALESVRRLEETLEGRRDLEQAAAARLARAREEAETIVREAREGAEREAAERKRVSLAAADDEAARVLAEAEKRARELRALAREDLPVAARELVALILPGRGA